MWHSWDSLRKCSNSLKWECVCGAVQMHSVEIGSCEGTTSGMQMHNTQNCNWSWFQGTESVIVAKKSGSHFAPVLSCSWRCSSVGLVQLSQALQSKTFPQSASEILGSPATAQRERRTEMRLTPA